LRRKEAGGATRSPPEGPMKRVIRWSIVLGILGLAGWLVAGPAVTYWQERNRVSYREVEVTRGSIVAVVNATGTVKPVRSVNVGSFVSGPILEIYVDFNDEVKKDQILAKIDPQIYEAAFARDKATLATQKATVERVRANLQQARNNEKRSLALRAENASFISDQEMDQFKFGRLSLEADLVVAQASVDQAQGNLDQSVANLGYTAIRSPVDGIVIDRKIDPGQTVAAQFQTPELFVVAPDMKAEMRVFASVDEADIGLIRVAQETGQPVRFTVDAYPDDLFEGKIFQIRKSSTTTQNVVTYPVVVSAPNPELKLLPGMTASLSFQLRATGAVLRVPNAALRFYPQREQVRPEDQELLERTGAPAAEVDDETAARTAEEKADLRRKRNRRHVWAVDGDFLRAIEIVTGVSNNQYTEVLSGEPQAGDRLVTGVQVKR
jgi:HlyD family secretion protein